MRNGRWRILSVLLMVCTLVTVSVLNCRAEDTALQKVLLRLKPAVVLVHSRIDAKVTTNIGVIEFDPIVRTGTGFIISPDGYLLTNGHVVADYQEPSDSHLQQHFFKTLERSKDPRRQYIKKVDAIKIDRKLSVVLSNGDPYVAEIKQFSPPITREPGKSSVTAVNYRVSTETGKDVAVLKIEGRDLPTVRLGDSGNVQLGEPIYIMGYPGVVLQHDFLSNKTALDSTVTIGHVSGSKLDVKGTPVIQTDASLTWGNSGGPAFNLNGEVIGIATFISMSNEAGSAQAIQGFNFLVPSNTAMEFVRASGANVGAESLFNKLWNEALVLYSTPDRDKALAKIDEVSRVLPNQPDVRKLQLAAQRMSPPPRPGFPREYLALAALGVALLGGLVAFLLLKKGKEAPLPASPPTVALAPKTKAVPPAAFVKCNDGPLAGRTYPITAEGVRIGRDPAKNQIVIDNEGISRQHASIVMENGQAMIKDHNSLNGTFLSSTEGDRIKSEVLKNGDLIILGKGRFATFTFSEG